MTEISKWIWVSFTKEGIHCYPAALEEESLSDVRFLGYPHRHIFHFKVWISISHDDRDIEFIQFKRWLITLYDTTLDLDNKSCEMIATDLLVQIQNRYTCRSIRIEVSEDNENGTLIEAIL